MKIAVLQSADQIAQIAADMYSDLLDRTPDAVIGLATGSSPLPVYQELISRFESGKISFKDARGFLLDEYVGLPEDHPECYANFINREFLSKVDFAKGAVQGPNGSAENPVLAANEYEQKIAESGGVDLQILGIGTDGHIAFNEPGGSLSSTCHTQLLLKQPRIDNARFFNNNIDEVPTMAITQGLATIMRAKKIVLVAQGKQKAQAIAAMAEGGVSALCPASILQFHTDVTVVLDEPAASELKMLDHYKDEWASQQEA